MAGGKPRLREEINGEAWCLVTIYSLVRCHSVEGEMGLILKLNFVTYGMIWKEMGSA